jgi:hypothetical protein
MLLVDFFWFVVVAGLSAPLIIGGYRLTRLLVKRWRGRQAQAQAWALLLDVLMTEIEQALSMDHLSKRRNR